MAQWQDIAAHEVPDGLTFLTPPQCQGQIVEVSYDQLDDRVYRRRLDHSDESVSYAMREVGQDELIEPWQSEPA